MAVGLFPTLAKKIAKHGPYKNLEDMYTKIPQITSKEKDVLKSASNRFTYKEVDPTVYSDKYLMRMK